METTKLTALETAALKNLATSDYGNPTWQWCATGGIVTKSAAGGVVSSLVKKGLVVCQGRGDDATITITAAGLAAVA